MYNIYLLAQIYSLSPNPRLTVGSTQTLGQLLAYLHHRWQLGQEGAQRLRLYHTHPNLHQQPSTHPHSTAQCGAVHYQSHTCEQEHTCGTGQREEVEEEEEEEGEASSKESATSPATESKGTLDDNFLTDRTKSGENLSSQPHAAELCATTNDSKAESPGQCVCVHSGRRDAQDISSSGDGGTGASSVGPLVDSVPRDAQLVDYGPQCSLMRIHQEVGVYMRI